VPPTGVEIEWEIEEIGSTLDEFTQAIHAQRLWKNADARDKDSITLQETVFHRLQEMIVRALCGVEWMEKEKRWRADPTEKNREDLEAIVEKRPGRENPVREALADSDTAPGMEEMKTWIRENRWLPQRREIRNIGAGARIEDLEGLSRSGLARFALQVMEDASVAAGWKMFDESVKQLIDNPDLARTARAVFLARCASTSEENLKAELVEA
jgi:hypothetical protein